MATTGSTTADGGVSNMSCGSFTGDGTATTVTLGFTPRRIHLINVTDRIQQIWQAGMAATTTLNIVAAGTATADTGSLIVPGVGNFVIASGAAISAKSYVWTAWG